MYNLINYTSQFSCIIKYQDLLNKYGLLRLFILFIIRYLYYTKKRESLLIYVSRATPLSSSYRLLQQGRIVYRYRINRRALDCEWYAVRKRGIAPETAQYIYIYIRRVGSSSCRAGSCVVFLPSWIASELIWNAISSQGRHKE